MMRRHHRIAVALLSCSIVALATPALASTSETPKIGAACVIKGKQVTISKQRLQCVQRNKRLLWARVAPLVTAPATATADPLRGTITVFAAASLTESFNALAQQFQRLHPAVQVTLSFGASSTLASQIINGAPADVFASASSANMQQVVDAKLATNPVTFARNRLIIVTPPGNPARITGIADLANDGVKVALCQLQVPCGIITKAVFTNAKVSVTPVTYEADVKAVLTKVLLGEVDAGLVYVTDARSAGDKVTSIPIPGALNAETTYPIALLKTSAAPTVAKSFIDFVRSDRGAAALAAVGFTVL